MSSDSLRPTPPETRSIVLPPGANADVPRGLGPDRLALPLLLTGVLSVLLVVHGCGAWPRAGPEEPERECSELPTVSLPASEDLLDVVRVASVLRALPDPGTELRLTLAMPEEGEEVRIFASDPASEGTVGLWPAVVREVLRSPPPSDAAPGVRLRLTTGSAGTVEVEAPTYCPARLINFAEVTARFAETAGPMPPAISVSVTLSEFAGIQGIRVSTQNGAGDDLEQAVWGAFHFARFQPAVLDGRPVPATLEVRLPATLESASGLRSNPPPDSPRARLRTPLESPSRPPPHG